MIIVDNLKENFCWQKKNGINIRSWYDDPNDTELQQLIPLLKSIVESGFDDVRHALANFRNQSRMGGFMFPSMDCIEEEKTENNDDTIEQSMSHTPLSMVDNSSISLRQSQLEEGHSSSSCQQITVNNTSYIRVHANRSTASASFQIAGTSTMRQDTKASGNS